MTKTMTVAEYLSTQLDACGKTRREAAQDAGYKHANFISMMALGRSQVPPAMVPALSKAMGIEPQRFMMLVMREYQPEAWSVLEQAFGLGGTANETDLIVHFREVTECHDPEFDQEFLDELEKVLLTVFPAAKHLRPAAGLHD